MKSHCLLLLILLFIGAPLLSQEVEISGIVLNVENQEPVEFVNIAIVREHLGTISNLKGRFTIKLPNKTIEDSITFSHINYHTLKLPVKAAMNDTVLLLPKTAEIEEIVLTNRKRKNRKLGVKSYNRLLSMRVVSEDNDIVEVAQFINIPAKEVRVKGVNFNIRKWSEIDDVKVRINFYENIDKKPGNQFIIKNIIRKMPTIPDNGWMYIDLTEEDIYISTDFFIGIEFLPNFKSPTIVDLGGILTKGKGYSRIGSLSKWGKLNGGIAINVEIDY